MPENSSLFKQIEKMSEMIPDMGHSQKEIMNKGVGKSG